MTLQTATRALVLVLLLATPALAIDIVGCDLVEVSPPFDHADATAMAANRAVLEAITQCVTFDITLEMSNPERVRNLNNAPEDEKIYGPRTPDSATFTAPAVAVGALVFLESTSRFLFALIAAIGIIFRGAAYALRGQGASRAAEYLFAISSVLITIADLSTVWIVAELFEARAPKDAGTLAYQSLDDVRDLFPGYAIRARSACRTRSRRAASAHWYACRSNPPTSRSCSTPAARPAWPRPPCSHTAT